MKELYLTRPCAFVLAGQCSTGRWEKKHRKNPSLTLSLPDVRVVSPSRTPTDVLVASLPWIPTGVLVVSLSRIPTGVLVVSLPRVPTGDLVVFHLQCHQIRNDGGGVVSTAALALVAYNPDTQM